MEILQEKSALKTAAAIREKKLSVTEVIGDYLEKIQASAYISILKETALERARELQSRIDKGETLSPLAGMPVALKDNISTMGIKTTCASKMLGDYIPVFSAAVVEKLEQAGLIIAGKLNMDEFDSGDSCSAGSPGLQGLALGSIKSYCGLTAIKPTYGSVSRYGIISISSSLEQTGVMGQNIEDCAALLSIVSGPDNRDSTCVIKKPFNFTSTEIKNLRIGVPYQDKDAVNAAAKKFKVAGCSIEEFDMPLADYIFPAYTIIEAAETSSNLAKYDGLKFGYRSANAKTLSEVYRLSRSEGFGLNIKRKIMLGSFVLSSDNYDAYFKKALQIRTLVREAYKKLFERFDLILSPVNTISVNLTGLPAVILPDGQNGFQLIGDAFCENKLIGAAQIYQGVLS
ncbi:MAG: amidase family protein [Treponema sp.]|nr:amidase family protein [Treponema sp.]